MSPFISLFIAETKISATLLFSHS